MGSFRALLLLCLAVGFSSRLLAVDHESVTAEPGHSVLTEAEVEYRDYLKALPPHIQDFIRLYEKARPGVRFDPRLMQVAEFRAKDCLLRTHGHVNDLAKQMRTAGYPLSKESFPDNMTNQFESLWAASTAQGALNGWAGHGPHAVHVFGQESPWNAYTKVGIGAYPYKGGYQWALITAP